MALSKEPTENSRIESWKEIAAFFGRDERTVRRWEKTRNLPVHRLPGEKGGVFAYTLELRTWLNSATPDPGLVAPEDDPASQAASDANSDGDQTTTDSSRKLIYWVLAGAALVAVAAVVFQSAHHGSGPGAAVPAMAKPLSPSESAAHELCLKGRYYWTHRTDGSMRQAVEAFAQAVMKDPQYAPAYAGLADSYNLMPEYGSMPKAQAFPLAIAAARRAVALDDSLSEAHRSLAFALFYWQWDVNDSFREFNRAIQLDPKDVEAHSWYATSLLTAGRLSAAREQIAQARELNPASRAILADEAVIRYWTGERAASLAELKELEESEPDFVAPPRYLAAADFDERNYPDYVVELKKTAAISKDPEETALAKAAEEGWKGGDEHAFLERLRVFYRGQFDRGVSSGFGEAYVCARLGRKAEADHYLQAAFDSHDYMVMTVLKDPFNSLMRGDPQFTRLEEQIRARMYQTPAGAGEHGLLGWPIIEFPVGSRAAVAAPL